jgi:hypothetical protein
LRYYDRKVEIANLKIPCHDLQFGQISDTI